MCGKRQKERSQLNRLWDDFNSHENTDIGIAIVEQSGVLGCNVCRKYIWHEDIDCSYAKQDSTWTINKSTCVKLVQYINTINADNNNIVQIGWVPKVVFLIFNFLCSTFSTCSTVFQQWGPTLWCYSCMGTVYTIRTGPELTLWLQ